jgi:hypothetical protein
VVSWGATVLRRGVLHGGGSFGVVVPAFRSVSAAGFTLMVFVTCLRGWSCGFALSLLSLLCVEFGRVVASVQPPSAYSCAAPRVEVPIQPDKFSFFFLFFCLPMIFQDHSLVSLSSISIKHALSWAVRSKKNILINSKIPSF